MQFPYHALTNLSLNLPLSEPSSVLAYSPVVLPGYENRQFELQLKVALPATKDDNLPLLLVAHGHGESQWINSLDGYTTMTDFFASHGFVVINPTFLDAGYLALDWYQETGNEGFWLSRAKDMAYILDHLDAIENCFPTLKGRYDPDKIAVLGHSFGGWTASMLLGATNTDPRTNKTVNFGDDRVKAGVIVSGMGDAGDNMNDAGRIQAAFYGPDFAAMTSPALVIYGDNDTVTQGELTWRGPDWHADPYTSAPSPKSLFTVKGGWHSVGGIGGFDALESPDESPQRLASVQRMSWAYLRSQLYGDDTWDRAVEAMKGLEELGTVENK